MHPTQSAIQANIPHNIPTARTHAPMNKHTATQAKITEKTSKKKNAIKSLVFFRIFGLLRIKIKIKNLLPRTL